ncbi:hypothetical protein Ocin01_06483 [Orchesella cincta]|uniref:Uncharacterized protein n=1 Tax=Orchesella cincta TaxID=48709 RepID=A0A1D2N4J3_ORCCI|nr:hypothetical protein Ocin01_06483 [Orchesella cincta]
MQRAIDSFFDANSDDDENNESTDSVMVVDDLKSATTPVSKTFPAVVTLDDVASPGADCKKEKEVESEKRNSGVTELFLQLGTRKTLSNKLEFGWLG